MLVTVCVRGTRSLEKRLIIRHAEASRGSGRGNEARRRQAGKQAMGGWTDWLSDDYSSKEKTRKESRKARYILRLLVSAYGPVRTCTYLDAWRNGSTVLPVPWYVPCPGDCTVLCPVDCTMSCGLYCVLWTVLWLLASRYVPGLEGL
jgi:hypothetical protein